MGALRRPQPEQRESADLEVADAPVEQSETLYPRWMVLSGLVAYCAVFWVVIWAAGSWGVALVRAAIAGQPE